MINYASTLIVYARIAGERKGLRWIDNLRTQYYPYHVAKFLLISLKRKLK